jgi:predicted MFS family arabinose efflux permease
MTGFHRFISLVFWFLGLLTTVVALVARITRPLRSMLEDRVELRSLLLLAGLFFLGTIATRALAPTARE